MESPTNQTEFEKNLDRLKSEVSSLVFNMETVTYKSEQDCKDSFIVILNQLKSMVALAENMEWQIREEKRGAA